MPDDRVFKFIRVKHETPCKVSGCERTLKPGDPAMWSQGGYVWCPNCPAPEMPKLELTPEQSMARLDAWIDRRIEEEAGRRRQAGPSGPHIGGGGKADIIQTPPPATPVSVTSDPTYEEAF